MERENLLRNIFIATMILLFALIVSTPLLITHGFSILGEEMVETVMIFVLFIIGFSIYFLYKRRLEKSEEELSGALNYIGAVNLQVDQIKSIFDILTKFPESKKDFKYLFESLADRALAGVNGDWVLFRIIDTNNGKTLTEYTKARGAVNLSKCEVSNKDLLGGKNPKGCLMVASMQENFSVKVFCVMPVRSISEHQKVLLGAIVNNLGMLYLIFESAAVKF